MKIKNVLELFISSIIFTSAFIFYGLLVYAMFHLLHYLGVIISIVGLIFVILFLVLSDYIDNKRYVNGEF
jgi:hypothetical protein